MVDEAQAIAPAVLSDQIALAVGFHASANDAAVCRGRLILQNNQMYADLQKIKEERAGMMDRCARIGLEFAETKNRADVAETALAAALARADTAEAALAAAKSTP